MGLHGFAAGLVIMVAGLEYLSPELLAGLLTGAATFLGNLSNFSQAQIIQEWA